jgi:hypothetical protein
MENAGEIARAGRRSRGLSPKRSEESEIRHLEPPQRVILSSLIGVILNHNTPVILSGVSGTRSRVHSRSRKTPCLFALPSDPERHSYHVLVRTKFVQRIPPPGLLERNRMLEARVPSPVPPIPSQKSRFFVHALERTPMRKISAVFPVVKSAETVALNANPPQPGKVPAVV